MKLFYLLSSAVLLISTTVGQQDFWKTEDLLSTLNLIKSASFDQAQNQYQKQKSEISINSTWIDEYIDRVLSCKQNEVGAIMVAVLQLNLTSNEVLAQHAKAYGVVDPVAGPDSEKVTADHRFCIGSITKHFTAATLGKVLSDKGHKYDWQNFNQSIINSNL